MEIPSACSSIVLFVARNTLLVASIALLVAGITILLAGITFLVASITLLVLYELAMLEPSQGLLTLCRWSP
jgi:hypothetical protein